MENSKLSLQDLQLKALENPEQVKGGLHFALSSVNVRQGTQSMRARRVEQLTLPTRFNPDNGPLFPTQ